MKKIQVASQYFFPEQFRINDICKELTFRNYEINVITAIPNYPEGTFFKGYSFFKHRTENYDGMGIKRLPIIPRGKTFLSLFLNYLSFVLSGFFWARLTKDTANMVFIYQLSPISMALPGIWFAKRRKIPVFLYVLDLWPESFQTISKSNFLINHLLLKLSCYIYHNATKILVSSEGFIPSITNKSVPHEKIIYWPQYAEDFYRPLEYLSRQSCEIPNDGQVNITFTGNIGVAQGLDVLVRTACLLKEDGIYVRFNIIGDGRYLDKMKQFCQDSKVNEYFNFLGKKPAIQIPEYLARSDAALICLSRDPLFALTLPAKVQSYMACAKPLIAAADGEIQKIIKDAEVGFFADAGDHEGLARAIKAFLMTSQEERAVMASSALTYYEGNFSKTMLLDSFEELISRYC